MARKRSDKNKIKKHILMNDSTVLPDAQDHKGELHSSSYKQNNLANNAKNAEKEILHID